MAQVQNEKMKGQISEVGRSGLRNPSRIEDKGIQRKKV